MKNWMTRAAAIVALVATTAGVVAVGGSAAPTASAQTASQLGAGGEYHPLTPTRIHDSRVPSLDVAPTGKKPTSSGGSTYSIPVLGEGGVPATGSDVLAVVVGVVVADATAKGNLALHPSGASAGTSSLVNFFPGRNVPNLAIVGVGPDGKIAAKITTPKNTSKVHVIVDVFGWFSTSSYSESGARLFPVGPNRLHDSREAGGALGTKQSRAIQVRGQGGVPNNSNVTGVMLNLTAINRQAGSRNTYVAVTPDAVPSGSSPSTSNINVVPNHVKASMVIVPIGSDGKVHLYNHSGETHVAVDVLGYMQTGVDPTSRTGRVIPLDAPFRVFDTRLAAFGSVPLAARSQENWSFKKFAESVMLGGTSVGEQSALIGNVTGTQLTRLYPTVPVTTYLSLYPGNAPKPNTSNLNVPEGENVPNMSMVSYGTVDENTGDSVPADPYVVQAYNHNGSMHYLLDVFAVVLK
jgi:hypothetical protein